MFKVARQIHFCYGHRLMDYAGKCRHPHGHNGRVEVEMAAGALNGLGMVMDFEDIKTHLQTWIDRHMDHQMLLRKDDPLAKVLKDLGEPLYLMDGNPTAENIAREIFKAAQGKNLPVRRVTLWETEKSYATYEPSGS
jgi:6-pyruvoyltetrahydropterin/6-carboxytetrahydropterin synthase